MRLHSGGLKLVGRCGRNRLRTALRHHRLLVNFAGPSSDTRDEEYYRRAADQDIELLERAKSEEALLDAMAAPLPYSEHHAAIADLSHLGVARLGDCLSCSSASALRKHCLAELQHAQEFPTGYDDGDENSDFSAVLGAAATAQAVKSGEHTRWDLRLPLTREVSAALCELLCGPLGSALEALVGAEGELHELACVITAPGAAPQVVHADADWGARATMYTAFVALQDVDADMGPTRFLRGTHTAEAHAALYERERPADVIACADARLAVLRTGDATVYDRRLLHAGASNRSNATRSLFYVTFRVAGSRDEDVDRANANSLRHEYAGKLRLSQLKDGSGVSPPLHH